MPSLLRAVSLSGLLGLLTLIAPPLNARADTSDKKDIVVNVHDLTGNAPLSGVKITMRIGNTTADGFTDDDGSAHLKIPNANSSLTSLSATADGLSPVTLALPQTTGTAALPDHLDLLMERAAGISGIVADQDGKPLAGASVVCELTKKYPNPLEEYHSSWRHIITDSDGKWSVSDVPDKLDSVAIAAYHKDCIDSGSFFIPEPFPDIAGLKNGTAIVKLTRGTPVQFIIHGPDGQPVHTASVVIGDDVRGSNSYPEEKTDANGIVQLGIAPGTAEKFVITAKGFSPELVSQTIGKTATTVNINLSAGHLLEGTLVDGSGDPVANGQIAIQSWRGTGALQARIRTDGEGKFSFPDAPADDLVISVYSPVGQKEKVTVRAGQENKIQLAAPSSFKGTVLDAATNKPITDYKVVQGIQWQPDQPVTWLYGNNGGVNITRDGNTFDATFGRNYPGFALRVAADGYLPQDSDIVKQGTDGSFTFKLVKGEHIKGIVKEADGKPVKGATVILLIAGNNISIDNGRMSASDLRNFINTFTADDGSFTLDPQNDIYSLVVLTDSGYAEVHSDDFEKDHAITLTLWAKVEGTIRKGTKPAAGAKVMASYQGERSGTDRTPNVFWNLTAAADSDGKFTLDRVISRDVMLGRELELGKYETTNVDSVLITAKSGETSTVEIGGVGRPIVGHIDIPPALAAKGFDYFEGSLAPAIRPDYWQPPAEVQEMTPADRNAWYKKWYASPEGKKQLKEQEKSFIAERSHMFYPKADGSFRIENIPQGNYILSVLLTDLHRRDQWEPGIAIGEASAHIDVPEIPGGVSDEPLDVGALSVIVAVTKDEQAPDFSIKTLDGTAWNLSAQKGKVVLLYFWDARNASYNDPLPLLQDIWNSHSQDAKFTMIGLSNSDKTGELTKKYAAKHELKWSLAWLGQEYPTATPRYFQHESPSFWIIDASGKIVGENLPKDQLKPLIESTLKSTP